MHDLPEDTLTRLRHENTRLTVQLARNAESADAEALTRAVAEAFGSVIHEGWGIYADLVRPIVRDHLAALGADLAALREHNAKLQAERKARGAA
jgi:hypothetical protein